MSVAVQTPQRPLPGAYVQTPAASRFQSGPINQPNFQSRSTANPQLDRSHSQSKALTEQRPTNPQQAARSPAESLGPIERAAKAINETLSEDTRFPELESYIGQGISSDYDISAQPTWAPFQKITTYNIPDKIFEQYNRAQVSTMMGLFADLNHAWVSIDNAVYLWDYTHPDPDLVGFEEQPNSVTAVRLVIPRAGVFNPSIVRLLVVATTADIILIGVSPQPSPSGGMSLSLFNTRLSISIRGIDVNVIEGSGASGRIFFSGKGNDNLYELTYQQEEKWFQNRCSRINHTGKSTFVPTLYFGQKPQHEFVSQIAVDDTRSLIYTLSSKSTIRIFHMKSKGGLDLVITKTLKETLTQLGHIASQSELISLNTTITSISPISSQEASKLHVMATTSTGCRVFMSATSYGWGMSTDSSRPPNSMLVQHVRFPPSDTSIPQASQPQGSNQMVTYVSNSGLNTSSKALIPTRNAVRYAPGYFFCFVASKSEATDALFISAPDAGRIMHSSGTNRLSNYIELGYWLNLGSRAEDIGLASRPFSAASSPTGFGNELAVQYDNSVSEIAILTNTGVHTLRRRRLVDIFATAIRLGGGDEGLAGEISKFAALYGRAETASTALAVACGQGIGVMSDSRVASISEPEVLEYARKAFVEYGGKATIKEPMLDQPAPTIDMVNPSSRHQGLSLYIARLVRSVWKAPIVIEMMSPAAGLSVSPAVRLSKLQKVTQDLLKLKEFLAANKSFIEGLAGPEALERVSTKQGEVCLQGEHRALHSLVVLVDNIIEGIAFVLVLFDERIEEIMLSLADQTRQQVRNLTYEGLFCTGNGRNLAKELVKAIVNRNIANGSNVDTVAEALRRRCGSFCSADDVIIFKAQELLKKASVEGSGSEIGRNLLNESLRLFKQVAAGHLSMEQLEWALQQYQNMQFFAGAIQLALTMAQGCDRGNRALTWIQEGRPEQDARAVAFESRKRCYNLVHEIITTLEHASRQGPEVIDGQYTQSSKRISEAYSIIDTSDDEVFQTDLYDWYLFQGRVDRLLDIQSPYIVTYLQRKSSDDIAHADLLWKYHNKHSRFHESAAVQLALAKSAFNLSLDRRIEYLGRAKANASTSTTGIARSNRQTLIREISDLLDVATIQSDLLQRLKEDERIAPARKPEVIAQLNGQILSLTELYNNYADQAGYFDLCLLIYQAADHRNPADIRSTWQNLLDRTHDECLERGDNGPLPYEAVVENVRTLGHRLQLSESMFPISDLLPMLKRYALEFQNGIGPDTWVIDTLIDLNVPFESLLEILENMFYADEAPFSGRNRRFIANDMLHVIELWFHDSLRGGGQVFGDEVNAAAISQTLGVLVQGGLEGTKVQECLGLRGRIEVLLR